MIRKIHHSIAFLFLGVVIAGVLISFADRIDPLHFRMRTRLEKLFENQDRYTVISVGNSHTRAINFDAMEIPGYHMWISGSDIFETGYLLKCIIPALDSVDMVLIGISPTVFSHDSSLVPHRKNHRMSVYYSATGWRSFIPIKGDWRNLVAGKLMGLVRTEHWQGVFHRLSEHGVEALDTKARKRQNILGVIMPDGHIPYRKKRKFAPGMDIARKTLVADRNIGDAVLCKTNDPDIEQRVYRQIVELIGFLKKNHIQPVFYTPPYTDLYIGALENRLKGTADRATELMRAISAEHGVAYYDFMRHRRFYHRYNLFRDMSHLNRAGAKRFSKQLGMRLKSFYSAKTGKANAESEPL